VRGGYTEKKIISMNCCQKDTSNKKTYHVEMMKNLEKRSRKRKIGGNVSSKEIEQR